ncbi:baculoviral IAP repeat-containing protein 7-B-like [Mya arenaria]|uniref:baculoviral IAP repeat-containing protein 7-B-like n=1 Tax=Mya arenaria TaxID=6604 RepID=UPI0022DF9991|nr:baculoviral IAP repeat-containing protein 7-B-like [Mya arenaria]XP_052810192.1 baculoviral IAP repeat-containing protein 7-B-like [Mya arenaria]
MSYTSHNIGGTNGYDAVDGFLNSYEISAARMPQPGAEGETAECVTAAGLDAPDCSTDDYTKRLLLKSEKMRLKTYGKWPKSAPVKPEELAREGFYYIGQEDHAKCIFCNLILKSWEKGDRVRSEHEKFNSMCPFLVDQNVGNVPLHTAGGRRSRHYSGQAKFPEYSKPAAREETFRKCSPGVFQISTDLLVEAGFYYTGPADCVTCYHCGILFRQWEAGDVPLDQHLQWAPHCEFAVVESEKRNRRVEETPMVKRVLDMGYDRDLVNYAVRQRKSSHGADFRDLNQLVDAVEQLRLQQATVYGHAGSSASGHEEFLSGSQSSGASSSFEVELRKMQDKLLCKICMERDVNIVFMPCGHLVACETCGHKLKNCPMCRKSIRGHVKTYMS